MSQNLQTFIKRLRQWQPKVVGKLAYMPYVTLQGWNDQRHQPVSNFASDGTTETLCLKQTLSAVMRFPKRYHVALKSCFLCTSFTAQVSVWQRSFKGLYDAQSCEIVWAKSTCSSGEADILPVGENQTTQGRKIWRDRIFVSALWWPTSKFLVSLQDWESQWRRNANYLADIQGWIMHLVIRSGTWALVGNMVYIIVTDGIRQQQSQSSSSAVHSLTPWPAVPKSCRALSAFYDWFMLRGVASLSNINVTRNVKVLFWLRETRPHRPLPWSSQTNVFLLRILIPEQFPARLQTYIS